MCAGPRSPSEAERNKKRKRNSQQTRNRRVFLQLDLRGVYEKPTAPSTLRWKMEGFSSRIRNKTRVPPLTTSTQLSTRGSTTAIRPRKRTKRHSNWKRRRKTISISRWHGNMHIKNPSECTKTIKAGKQTQQSCRTHNQHTKISGICTYIHDEQYKNEIKKTRIRYLGINLT